MPQNDVYDPDADERPVRHHAPSDDGLRNITGINPEQEEAMDREAHSGAAEDIAKREGLFKPNGDAPETSKGADSPEDLKAKEQAGGLRGLYNQAKDQKAAVGQRLQSKLGKFAKSKWLIGAGLSAGGILAFMVFLFFFLGALKIPHFMENMTTYQFTRTTRQMARHTQNITEEKMVIDAADQKLRQRIKARFNDSRFVTKTKSTWAKLDKYRPNKIINKYDSGDTFSLKYNKGRLVAVTLTDKTILIDEPRGFGRLIPSIRFKSDVQFAREVAPSLRTALKADGIGPIVRWRVTKQIRARLGISLVAWKLGQYTGKTPAEAELQQARDMVKAVSDENIQRSQTQPLNDTAEDAKEQLDEDIKDDKKLKQIIDDGGLDKEVVEIIDKGASGKGWLKGIAGFVSPIYSIAMPVCMVYDGSSIKQNGPTINSRAAANKRAFSYGASAAHQVKNGYGASAEAMGAYGDRLGDITQSPSELRAGGVQVDTSQYPTAHTQSTPGGDHSFTAFNAAFGNGAAANAASAIANNVCKVATDVELGIAFGVGNLAACFNPIGGTEACVGEKAAAEGARRSMGKIAQRVVSRIASKKAATRTTAIVGYLERGMIDMVKTGAATAAATYLAKSIILSRMNGMNNGLQSNADLTAAMDSGANEMGSQINQEGFYGRPLTNAEAADTRRADKVFLSQKASTESFVRRYASLNNPNSLLARFGLMTMGRAKPSSLASLLKLSSTLLQPLKSLANLFTSLNSRVSAAGSTSVNSDYGNVQRGYSNDEMKLLETDLSYRMLANQSILDESRQEEAINKKYGVCFDGNKQIGDLLAEGMIQRQNETGDVLDEGLCSPKNLGLGNSEFGPQMVFRWRVAQGYNNTIDQLLEVQDAQ